MENPEIILERECMDNVEARTEPFGHSASTELSKWVKKIWGEWVHSTCLQQLRGLQAQLPGAFPAVGRALVAAAAQHRVTVLAVKLAVGEVYQRGCLQRRVARSTAWAHVLQHRVAAQKIRKCVLSV